MLIKKLSSVFVLLAFLLAGTPALAEEEPKQSGWIDFTATQIALGIGVGWGSGELRFQGKRYPIKINGLQLVGVGYAEADVTGEVFDLNNVEDITGNYGAWAAGATLAGGAGNLTMKNDKGVKINMWSRTKGLSFSLGGGGVKIQLEE